MMTKEEVIKELNRQFEAITQGGNVTKESEALRYAITVLNGNNIIECPWCGTVIEHKINKEPCDDAISREKALEPYKGLNDDDVISVGLIKRNIKKLPSVQPKVECDDAISREAVTNGEVIKKTFPHYDIEIDEHKGYARVFYDDFYTTYPWKWWNASYKADMRGDTDDSN